MRRPAALPFVLVTVFIDMLGLGIIVPIAPRLITVLSGQPAAGARWFGVLAACYGLLQFLCAPVLGALSDRYGRRPVLLVSLAMLGLDYLVAALTPSIVLLFASRALAGATAGNMTVAHAYVADVTPPAARARAFGLVGAAFSVGFITGPVLGGLLGAVSLRAPFYAAAGLAFINVGYGLLVLPESLPRERRRPTPARLAGNPGSAIVDVLRRPGLARPAWARLCGDIARQVNQTVWVLYATERFGWTTTRLGLAIAFGAVCGTAVGVAVVDRCVRLLGERRSVVLGSAGWAATLAGSALAPRDWLLYPLMGLGSLGFIAGAATQSWLTRGAGPHEQGRVQGALTSISGLTEAAVPAPAAALFAWSVTVHAPGLALLVASGFLVAAALVAWGDSSEPARVQYPRRIRTEGKKT
jgi:DHA1 family tetracycline resistance protein-like MFS transporter